MNRSKAQSVLLIALFTFTIISGPALARSPTRSNAQSSTTCPSNDIFKMVLPVPPPTLNILTTATSSSAFYIITLEYWDPGPVPTPNGVGYDNMSLTAWITHNANYTLWTFNVKSGLKWSDGTNVTGTDVVTSYGPKFALNSTYDFPGIESEVKTEYAQNSTAAVFVLNQSDAHFYNKIGNGYFSEVYPASFINSKGVADPNLGTNIAVGPFYVSNYTAGSTQMTLLRNSNYKPQPTICEINIQFVETLSLTTNLLATASSDFGPVEYTDVGAVLRNPAMSVFDYKGYYISDIDYNDSIYPYNMTAFRQALAYAINQSQVVKQAYNGYGVPAYSAEGAVSPTATVNYNSNQPKYSFNQTKSLSLLQSVGINKQSDNLLHYPNGTTVSLSLWTDTDNTEDPIAASIIQSYLQTLGFKINLVTASGANIIGDYSSNVNNIQSAMILATTFAPEFGNQFIDILPGWDVYWLPTTPSTHWLYPPSADAEYQGNASAYYSTADPALDQQYLFNIEALNAQYLPSLVVAYPDALYAYNTQRWTNWPTGNQTWFVFQAAIFNVTALATLSPSAATTTSSTSPTSTQTSATTGSTTSTASGSSVVPITGGGGSGLLLPVAVAVIVILVVVIAVAFFMRRR